MMKQSIASLLIAIMVTVILTMPNLQTVLAQQHHIDGEDLGYNESISLGYNPWYCECNHLIWEADPEDSEAGLGVDARYCLVGYPQNPMFDWARWCFEGECGIELDMYNVLIIDPCVNGNDHHYYYYYCAQDWGPPPWNPPPPYSCYYHYYEVAASMDPCYSVEGLTAQCFYANDNPWENWYVQAFTQNPPYDPYGYGWGYLSAHW
ncbi:MAG: hypothetical protein NWE95_08435 [Candidatus Bathyarchaeota archaeon]|nr:hypothetical protein [Candidatus Bathyarchaeota archaeon]